ncbi:MAG: hypothetical protein JO025_13275 [Verrucomicrobia bacterium]|nr:hypothetical protein [Verrucomicrobiota bacterium]
MKTSKIAGLVLASILAVAPVALAGGLRDIRLPDSRFSTGDIGNSPLSTHSRSIINFYTSTEASQAKGWHIAPY